MPAKATTTKTTKRKTAKRSKDGLGSDALERLQDSIDAAEVALKDLRGEMSRGSHELLTDVERTLKDARKNVRRASRAVAKDLEHVQKAAAGRRTTRRAPSKTSSRRSSARARS